MNQTPPNTTATGDRAAMYDAYYYAHDCGTPYERNETWLGFFGLVADWIVHTIRPTSVLDAGCAFGFLVEALRARGVEAEGLDISEHALAQADPAVRPYLRVGSILEPFGRRYDLIVSIEVVEHLPSALAAQAVANFAAHTDDVLFSSTPYDYQEITHLGVRPPDHWVRLFAEQGLLRDVAFDATYINAWAMRFRRAQPPLPEVVAAYERELWRTAQEANARRDLAFQQREDFIRLESEQVTFLRAREQLENRVATLESEAAALHLRQGDLIKSLEWREQQVAVLQRWHDDVVASAGWRLVTRLQGARGLLAPPGSGRERWLVRLVGAGGGAAPPEPPTTNEDSSQP